MIPAMEYRDQDVSNCSIARALEIVGQPWVLLVLREAFRGIRRFDEIQDHLGVSRSVLAGRLEKMVGAGLLERQAYREQGQRTRWEYQLTDKGRELYPVLTALRQWGDAHLADPEGPPVLAEHADCGAQVRVQLVCDHGHALDGDRDVIRRPGPSARLRQPALH
jgi:DNA-binding HxlR family transcriptional regulator